MRRVAILLAVLLGTAPLWAQQALMPGMRGKAASQPKLPRTGRGAIQVFDTLQLMAPVGTGALTIGRNAPGLLFQSTIADTSYAQIYFNNTLTFSTDPPLSLSMIPLFMRQTQTFTKAGTTSLFAPGSLIDERHWIVGDGDTLDFNTNLEGIVAVRNVLERSGTTGVLSGTSEVWSFESEIVVSALTVPILNNYVVDTPAPLAGGAITIERGFYVKRIAGATKVAFQSDDTAATIRLAGSARIGGTGAPTASVGLDVIGTLNLWPTLAASAGNPTRLVQWNGTLSLTTSDDLVGIALLPTITLDAFTAPNIYGVRATPTITAQSLHLASFQLFDGNPTIATISTSAVFGHPNSYMYRSRPTVTYSTIGNSGCGAGTGNPIACCTGAGTGTCSLVEASAKLYGLWSQPTVQTTSTGALTYGVTRDVVSEPTYAASGASGSLTITARQGLLFNEPTYTLAGSSTLTVTDQIAVDVGVFANMTSGNRTITNIAVIRSALNTGTGGTVAKLINATGTAPSDFGGKFTKYNGVTTAGYGIPTIVAAARAAAVTAAQTSVATFTPTADGTFIVSANVLVTASTTHSFSVSVTYTDEGNTPRTLVMPMAQLAGTFITTGLITNVTGVGPYESAALHIRVKASTAITITTAGTFTSVTYNVDGLIQQVA